MLQTPKSNHNHSRLFILLAIVLISVGLFSSDTALGAESCTTAQTWVLENANRLPTTYEEFNRYTLVYRKAIFSALSPQAKSALWRQQFNRYIADPNLTAEQVSVVQQAIVLVSPEFFDTSQAELRTSVEEQLKAKASAVFNADEVKRIFMQLGPTDKELPGNATAAYTCDCSTKSPYCGTTYSCKSDGCGTTGGCGWLMGYTCDGRCYPQ